jgi:prepilin-type N-terminal cleavage/methylation domain-containing protein
MRKQGFTLVELMLVVTLLAIIFGIAVPALLTAKKSANEGVALSSLRTLSHVQLQYRTRYGTYGNLTDLVASSMLDDSLASGTKSGYQFISILPADPAAWAISGQPITPGVSGDRWFFVDESGILRFKDGGAATSTDAPVD